MLEVKMKHKRKPHKRGSGGGEEGLFLKGAIEFYPIINNNSYTIKPKKKKY